MPDPSAPPCVLVVADSDRIAELVGALSEPLPTAVVSRISVALSSGGDDTIDLFESRRPHVVVVTASLEAGDATALVDTLRGMVPRAEVAVVVVGDLEGPTRTALDAIEMTPDRFVSRPLSARTLRFAVASALEAVILVRTPVVTSATVSGPVDDGPTEGSSEAQRAAQRARWEALADSLVEPEEEAPGTGESTALPPPVIIRPRRHDDPDNVTQVPSHTWKPGATSQLDPWTAPEAPAREPTLILPDPPELDESDHGSMLLAMRAREPSSPPPLVTPRTLTDDVESHPQTSRTQTVEPAPTTSRTRTGDDRVDLAERDQPGGAWSDPMPLAELLDPGRDSPRHHENPPLHDDLPDDEFEDDLEIGHHTGHDSGLRRQSEGRLEVLEDLPDAQHEPPAPTSDGRDFARQLRAKMSMMAQRLFQGADASTPNQVDLGPRHDHHTEIDLSSLGDDMPLGGGHTEIEPRQSPRVNEGRELTTSPGSWDTHVRERGLPDSGELMRGVSDAPMVIAKMFASGATGRVAFRRDEGETVVFFDQGRPVFASSTEPRDRMGELLVREGKITASQYERCQAVVAESGRRMGEILVDFGYLKRRELLPAVRRHVEDIVYALFSWERGHFQITLDTEPSAERIRLSRHPAALVLEGIRRKLDRSTLERLVGPPSTVIEVSDRERLGGIISTGDLAAEERAALAAIDGVADLSQVASVAGVDLADVLPLGWGLCVLGLATARRMDTEVPDESTALVGETDLAIDRERVRARWQLVTDADYFALLGVRRDASAFEIRRAYQSARRDFAVESFPTDLRRELAQELDDIANVLDEAFRVLRDDRLRVTYLAHLVE
ncbi:MAG: response regulator receiver protein [Deltaproteobacteria bacterium]|nr:response regulator receiver protein [Deltaproteobacteria bacterium]